jgi:hypothetical protein
MGDVTCVRVSRVCSLPLLLWCLWCVNSIQMLQVGLHQENLQARWELGTTVARNGNSTCERRDAKMGAPTKIS